MIWLFALLVIIFSGSCAKRPTEVSPTSIPKSLEKCIGNNHSFATEESFHIVQKGETLYRISQSYGVSLEEVSRINGIVDPTQISVGQRIAIPGRNTSGLIWPVNGKISSGFGRRGWRGFHSGIDIPARKGTPIRAVADGLVIVSGKSLDGYSKYGRVVVVQHGDGMKTLYAHNHKNHVTPGDCVRAKEIIGEVGSTGNASGSHLHFEIRKNEKLVNPLKYLP